MGSTGGGGYGCAWGSGMGMAVWRRFSLEVDGGVVDVSDRAGFYGARERGFDDCEDEDEKE